MSVVLQAVIKLDYLKKSIARAVVLQLWCVEG